MTPNCATLRLRSNAVERGTIVSTEIKRVKLMTLAELFLGIALLAGGVVVAAMGAVMQSGAFLLAGEGLVTSAFGVRGALIANVPARIGKLATLALVIALVQIACCVGTWLLLGTDEQSDYVCLASAAVPALISCVIWLLSRGMAKRAER